MILMTPTEGKSMENLVKLNKEWFESIFDTIDPWSENSLASHKFVWVRCIGLPILFLNKDCFAKVVGEVVSLVFIDKDTEN